MSMIGNLLRVSQAELDQYLADSSLLESRIYDEDSTNDDSLLDIDKSWDGILFLLTGESIAKLEHPLGSVLFSGQLIDEEQDMGYGPAHYLLPAQVKELSDQISSITKEQLREKYNPSKMDELEVYPNIWDEEEAFEYLSEYFSQVQQTYSAASKNGEAIITFIS